MDFMEKSKNLQSQKPYTFTISHKPTLNPIIAKEQPS